MSEQSSSERFVEAPLDELPDIFAAPDPLVLLFRSDGNPVVANVRGELRMLSSSVLHAREVSEEDVKVAYDRHGEPEVLPLSTQYHRFSKRDFEHVADLEGSHV